MIYFDNAATTMQKPKKVIDEVVYSIKNHGNPGRGGYPLSLDASKKIFGARLALANFFGSYSPERVIFTMNATMSLNIAIKCFMPVRDNADDNENENRNSSHILISCFEHNSVYRPVNQLCRTNKTGYKDTEYDVFDVDADDEKTVNNAVNMINEKTRMIVLTHVSNVCGKILPVREIIKKVKEKNPDVITVVDAAQSAGVLDINIYRDNIDILCVPSHKSMLGLPGLGIMILNDKLEIPEASFIEGGTGINSLDLTMPQDTPEHFEAGTPNTPAICALSAAVEYINSETPEKIYSHEKILYNRAVNMLKEVKKVKLYSGVSGENYIGAVLFNIDGYKCEEAARILTKNQIFVRDGYHCSLLAHQKLGTIETGGIRVSFGYRNTLKELDKFYSVIKNL